jgi:hypothetical protein
MCRDGRANAAEAQLLAEAMQGSTVTVTPVDAEPAAANDSIVPFPDIALPTDDDDGDGDGDAPDGDKHGASLVSAWSSMSQRSVHFENSLTARCGNGGRGSKNVTRSLVGQGSTSTTGRWPATADAPAGRPPQAPGAAARDTPKGRRRMEVGARPHVDPSSQDTIAARLRWGQRVRRDRREDSVSSHAGSESPTIAAAVSAGSCVRTVNSADAPPNQLIAVMLRQQQAEQQQSGSLQAELLARRQAELCRLWRHNADAAARLSDAAAVLALLSDAPLDEHRNAMLEDDGIAAAAWAAIAATLLRAVPRGTQGDAMLQLVEDIAAARPDAVDRIADRGALIAGIAPFNGFSAPHLGLSQTAVRGTLIALR